MGIRDVLKVSFRTYFNPKAWLGWNELKAYNKDMFDLLKDAFKPVRALRSESFEQALKRLKLSEEDLKKITSNFIMNKFIFYTLSIFSFFLGFYYLFQYRTIAGWFLWLSVMAIFLSQAFRFSFYEFQIKQRKLGCTFNEWWHGKTEDGKG